MTTPRFPTLAAEFSPTGAYKSLHQDDLQALLDCWHRQKSAPANRIVHSPDPAVETEPQSDGEVDYRAEFFCLGKMTKDKRVQYVETKTMQQLRPLCEANGIRCDGVYQMRKDLISRSAKSAK
jgi:hypothetical protein